jgi:hypothetical protein
MATKYRDLEQRLICNSFVDLEDSGECWIWLGRRLPDGYGLINVRVDGKHKALRARTVSRTPNSLATRWGRAKRSTTFVMCASASTRITCAR